jgi:hypothetical protein
MSTDLFLGQPFRLNFSEKETPNRSKGFPAVVFAMNGSYVSVVYQSAKGIKTMEILRRDWMSMAFPDCTMYHTKAIYDEFRSGFPLDEDWSKDALRQEAISKAPKKEQTAQPIILPVGRTMRFKVHADFHHNIAIETNHVPGFIFFIPILVGDKLEVQSLPSREFEGDWKQLPWCPVPKAAALVLEYLSAGVLKATPEAKDFLRQALNKESEMAEEIDTTAKPVEKKSAPKAKTEKKTAPKAKAEKKPAAKAKTEKKTAPKTAKETKAPKERKETASSMLRDLIAAGTLTDDQIFAKVKAKYDLGDDKRWYVSWYRNDMKKKGLNPPAAKEAKK